MVAQAVLVPAVVLVPVDDAEEVYQEPCTALDPPAGASRAVYPLGVLIVVLAARPTKNTSLSLALTPDSDPPLTVVPEMFVLLVDAASGLEAVEPETSTTSMVVVTLSAAANVTVRVPLETTVPETAQASTMRTLLEPNCWVTIWVGLKLLPTAVPVIELIVLLLLDPCR